MSVIPARQNKTASEVRNVAIDFRGKLDAGELLTGTPTTAEVGTADLTFANQKVNTVALTVEGEEVAIGQAVQFKVSGGAVGTVYKVKITVTTTSTPAQTLIEDILIRCIAD